MTKPILKTIEDLEFFMSEDCVADCSHQGQCDDDVAHWSTQFENKIPHKDLEDFCNEWGLSNEQGEMTSSLFERVIWVVACNKNEEN